MSAVPQPPAGQVSPPADRAAPTRPSIWRAAWRTLGRKRVAVPLLILIVLAAAGWRYRISRPDYRLSRGEDAVREGDWEAAEGLAARLAAAGHVDRAHWLRAQIFFAQRRWTAALSECERVRPDSPFGLRAATLAGKCLLEQEDLVGADRAFRSVLASDPDAVDVHRGLAAVAYDLGQLDRAIHHLEQVIRLDPGDARPHRFLAEIYRDAANPQTSLAEFREALRLRTGLSATAIDEVRFEIAHGRVQLTQYEEALAALDEAAADGRDEPPYMQALRVEALRGLGRIPEAVTLVDAALAAYPDEAAFLLLRGQLYLDGADPAAAIPVLERSAATSPRHYQSHFLLAQAYARAGRRAEAERVGARADQIRRDYDLLTALSREASDRPWDPGVRLRLAEFCDRSGDTAGAVMWRKAAAACAGRSP